MVFYKSALRVCFGLLYVFRAFWRCWRPGCVVILGCFGIFAVLSKRGSTAGLFGFWGNLIPANGFTFQTLQNF